MKDQSQGKIIKHGTFSNMRQKGNVSQSLFKLKKTGTRPASSHDQVRLTCSTPSPRRGRRSPASLARPASVRNSPRC